MAMADNFVLEVEDLCIEYNVRGQPGYAVTDASLKVRQGGAVGLVGESGCGKSTLARSLIGLLPAPDAKVVGGRIILDGKEVSRLTPSGWEDVRGRSVAMVFQDPMAYLNPIMTAGRQIAEAVRRHYPGLPTRPRVKELLELVRLPQGTESVYPHQLSGGMRQRVLLAVALACGPKLLIADEPTTALDVTTQAEILSLLDTVRKELGMALLLISHDLAIVNDVCDRVYVMYAGRTIESGLSSSVFQSPAHPYTQGLLGAATLARDASGELITIPGEVPNMEHPIPGCPFQPRCPFAMARCAEMPPEFPMGTDADHTARCWLLDESSDKHGVAAAL